MANTLPTISQYIREYVNHDLDLKETDMCACPFHHEKKGKSFSVKGRMWRCFGACQTGGDVIDLHKFNFKLKTREEAEQSLYQMYHIEADKDVSFVKREVQPDEVLSKRQYVYNRALAKATDPDSWVELDYILSKVPFDVKEMEMFIATH